MGTTTININGIPAAGSGGNTGAGNVGGQTGGTAQNASVNVPTSNDNNGGYSLPSNERMIEDIRREMRQRGVMLVPGSQSMHKIIDEYAQNQRKLANQSINERYDDLSNNLAATREEELERRKKQRLANAYMNYRRMAPDDWTNQQIEGQFEYSSLYAQAVKANKEDEARVKRGLNSKDDELLRKAQEERTEVDKELAEAIKTLTSYFEREAETGSNNSYLGRLKEERKQLILERDSALTEEEAIAAQTKLNDVNSRIQRVLSPGLGDKKDEEGINSLLMAQGLQGVMSSMGSGDILGGLNGMATFGLAASGLSKAAMRKALGWIGLGIATTKGIVESFRKVDDAATAYAVVGGESNDFSKEEFFDYTDSAYHGIDFYNLGMKRVNFAELMVNYMQSAGMKGSNIVSDALLLSGAEKHWGLQGGALSKLAKFTRYTRNPNAAFGGYEAGANIDDAAAALGMLYGNYEGFRNGDHSNAQKVLDAYTSILESYGSRSNKVNNFETAASLMMTMSSAPMNEATGGKSLFDERTASEIATFQNMIQSPANDRMQALIFGEVGKMIGSTDLSKIDQYIIDPKNELKIMQQVVKKISDLYGGVDTEMGYWAFKQLLPGMAPDRRKEYIDKLTSGYFMPGDINSGKEKAEWGANVSGAYVSDITETENRIADYLAIIANKLEQLFD